MLYLMDCESLNLDLPLPTTNLLPHCPEPAGGINTAACFAGSHLDLQKHQLRSNSVQEVLLCWPYTMLSLFIPNPLPSPHDSLDYESTTTWISSGPPWVSPCQLDSSLHPVKYRTANFTLSIRQLTTTRLARLRVPKAWITSGPPW